MPRQRQSDAAKLTQHRGAGGIIKIKPRLRIVVNGQHVAHLEVVAAAGRNDQPGRVVLLGPLGDLFGLELSPSLIKGNPGHHRRMRVQQVHDRLPFSSEIGF